jgi:hypothetical protein
MESTFHATVYSVVDRLLERIATECMEDKPKLWAIWKEMFAFPQDPPTKEKKLVKETPKEAPKEEKKPAKKVEKKEEKKPVKEAPKEEKKPEPKEVPKVILDAPKEEKKVILEEEKHEAPKEEKKVVLEEEKHEAPKEEKKVVLEEEKHEAPKEEKKVVLEEEEPAHKSPKAAKPGTCPWVYTKGPRQGQVCGVGIYSKNPESGLCHSHYKK